MATLLLRLSAPMQAWGTQSNFGHRDTEREPSKSGVIGLLCAALGRPRHERIDDLAALRMGVRLDQPGFVHRDYHTAGKDGYYQVNGGVERKNLITSDRYYLADARFLVGLEGDAALLEHLHGALQRPAWFLFLGRKSFIPAERVWLPDGRRDTDVWTALQMYGWLGQGKRPATLRVMLEDASGSIRRMDQPVSFEPRRCLPRYLRAEMIPTPPDDTEQGQEG